MTFPDSYTRPATPQPAEKKQSNHPHLTSPHSSASNTSQPLECRKLACSTTQARKSSKFTCSSAQARETSKFACASLKAREFSKTYAKERKKGKRQLLPKDSDGAAMSIYRRRPGS